MRQLWHVAALELRLWLEEQSRFNQGTCYPLAKWGAQA